MSHWIARRRSVLWVAAGAVLTVAAVLVAARLAGATMPYNPLFEMTGISSTAPTANANITFRTTLPAGNGLIGTYGLEIPDNSWTVAGHSNQLNGKVTVFGTLTVNLDPDGSCTNGTTGSPQNYGPFYLVDVDPGLQGPYAKWFGTITDFNDGNPSTNWYLTLTAEPLGVTGYTIDGFVTDVILPPGNTICTPEIFTLTFCGRANPTLTAACGSGSDPVLLTNPSSAGCYLWRLVTIDESGMHSANPQAGVSIGGTPCDADGDGVPDPGDNCPRWPNPAQILPPWPIASDDPDCDGFSTAVENPVSTNFFVQCGTNAWPADINNDGFSDVSDISTIGSSFGKPVGPPPNAPARYNIAPDPVDGFVDITDITRMGGFFGKTCRPCPGDLDCDTITDSIDNCPNWPNLSQNLPPWLIPANDPDCDGFSTNVENSAGTAPLIHCGTNAWPADINNDGFSDVSDISSLGVFFGKPVGPSPNAPARYDIAPDPVDGFVDITDITKMGGFFGKNCS